MTDFNRMSEPESSPNTCGPSAVERVVQVEHVNQGIATVVADPLSACKGCAQNQSCGQATLSGMKKPMRLQVRNTLQAQVGDWVVIAVPGGSLLRDLGIGYGVPLVGFLCGGLLGSVYGDSLAVILAAVGLGLGIILSRWMVASSAPSQPTMIRKTTAP